MKFVLAAGTTRTAGIEGLSAAGANPDLRMNTPSADADILAFGRPVQHSIVPISPTGCPTPAVITRAARELHGFRLTVLNAGLASPTAVQSIDLGADPGGDIRDPVAVPDTSTIFEAARKEGRLQSADESIFLAETIPAGTTTAMGVLRALGESSNVSSSLPSNPLDRKNEVVNTGLETSELEPGGAAGDPLRAIRAVGDPVLAALLGYSCGALESGVSLTFAGGTQLLTVAACLRHAGLTNKLNLATTVYVHSDPSATIDQFADDLDVSLKITDPGFDAVDHPSTNAYLRGEAKEGVGMGGALLLISNSTTPMATLRKRVISITDRLLESSPETFDGMTEESL